MLLKHKRWLSLFLPTPMWENESSCYAIQSSDWKNLCIALIR